MLTSHLSLLPLPHLLLRHARSLHHAASPLLSTPPSAATPTQPSTTTTTTSSSASPLPSNPDFSVLNSWPTPPSIFNNREYKYAKPIKRSWHLFDAKNQIVGRLAVRLASLLCGKHKPVYSPHLDHGDHVVVINARHVKFTGDKINQKLYRYHSGYPGGLKEIPVERWLSKHPTRVLHHAVAGMIKKNKLKVPRLERLKIYADEKHPHTSQFPVSTPRILAAFAQSEYAHHVGAAPVKDEAGLLPNEPTLRDAIVKDREKNKGKPPVRL